MKKNLALIAFALIVSSAPVAAAEVTQTMNYEVYAGGINAVSAQLDVADQPQDRYALSLAAKTKGFLAKLAPWSGTFETKGWRLKDRDAPEQHKSVAQWRDEDEVKTYSYDKSGAFMGYEVIEEGKKKDEPAPESDLTRDTTDALTVTLAAMRQVAATGTCDQSSEVFDGDRRFKLVFKQQAEDMLEKTNYNVYAGKATRCVAEVQPIKGRWHTKPRGWMSIQEQGRLAGELPTIWFAKISENGPAVPVKIRVKTDYGTLFAHLTRYADGAKTIAALP